MDPWKFWKERLEEPRYILAPMVDHSELPWRMLSREYGCQAAYTPMFHASHFTQRKYRQKFFTTCPEDRPLIVQFCANNADTFIAAAMLVENDCDAIDLNLGCPQEIARRGHYGCFLQDEWTLINEMISRLRANINKDIGVSCKIRCFEDTSKTIDYARMIEKAGCSFIGVHGRTRDQRGTNAGLANWNPIREVKKSVTIPVIANGNIQSLKDANECLEYTNADAIMTAEGNLYNPSMMLNLHEPAWEVARKYLKYVEKYPIHPGMAKSHIFKLFHRCIAMDDNVELRNKLGASMSLDDLYKVISKFEEKYKVSNECQTMELTTQPVPPYLCQPRYRYSASTSTLPASNANLKPIAQVKNSHSSVDEENFQKRIKV